MSYQNELPLFPVHPVTTRMLISYSPWIITLESPTGTDVSNYQPSNCSDLGWRSVDSLGCGLWRDREAEGLVWRVLQNGKCVTHVQPGGNHLYLLKSRIYLLDMKLQSEWVLCSQSLSEAEYLPQFESLTRKGSPQTVKVTALHNQSRTYLFWFSKLTGKWSGQWQSHQITQRKKLFNSLFKFHHFPMYWLVPHIYCLPVTL